jgi:heat shock protein HspQ
MDLSDFHYVVFMSIKDEDNKLKDIPLYPCLYENDANNYITGYVHAIINHTGESDEDKIRGQFSIRDVAGLNINKKEVDTSTNKETK